MALIHERNTNQHTSRETIYHRVRLTRDYITSYYRSRSERRSFQTIATYCMFIGHARSGHSIVGAMLDAHPNVILPDEVDALQYLAAGFSREQIFQLLLARSQRQARKGRTKAGRNGKVYSYRIPDQWQGRFSTLKVIGDSKAGKSTQHFARNPALLNRLRERMADIDVKLIHVVRNPYDNISTLILRGGRTFDNAIVQYFANCEALAAIRSSGDSAHLLTIQQEQVILQPSAALHTLCAFLNIPATEDYIRACASILYTALPKSRYSVPWTEPLIDQVRRQIDKFDFLAGYTYADAESRQASRALNALTAGPPAPAPIRGEIT